MVASLGFNMCVKLQLVALVFLAFLQLSCSSTDPPSVSSLIFAPPESASG